MSKTLVCWVLLALLWIPAARAGEKYECIAAPNPPKLPVTRASGRKYAGSLVRVQLRAGIADTWKATRRETGWVDAGTMVEVLEDLVVVDAPDVVWVAASISELHVKEGDTILRYARLGEGWADLWAQGCWYKDANADFITDPDGAGCNGSRCSAKVTKLGKQFWWFRIKLPDGTIGWTLSQALDVAAGA